MTITKNEILNQMALSYTQGNEFALVELSESLASTIRNKARNAARKAEERYVFIPATEFESAYTEALWEAARTYDGSSEFMQRFHTCTTRNEALVWRSYRVNKDGKATYVKGKSDYLDKPVGGENNETLGDVVLVKMAAQSAEDHVVGENALLDTIEEFRTHNERFYTIIKALANQLNNDEIAVALGKRLTTERFARSYVVQEIVQEVLIRKGLHNLIKAKTGASVPGANKNKKDG